MSRQGCAWLLAALLCLAACGGGPQAETAVGPVPAQPTEGDGPLTTVEVTAPTTTTVPTMSTGPADQFSSQVLSVTAADLPASWRPGCPVAPEELRLVKLTYWGFDERPHDGSLVVNASAAEAMVDVFRRLFAERFPIRRMEPIDVFGGSDEASTEADNTAAFNCRNAVAEGPPHWSMHAYGLAIDVNPIENPYLLGGRILPPAGRDFLDRSSYRPGMAVEGGVLTSAFAAVGWQWGGRWADPDYQHFSSTGR